MAQVAINGDHAPPTHHDTADIDLSDATNNKRKREDGADVSEGASTSESRMRQIQRDILQVLGQNDTEPSFLKHTFTSTASDQPSQKKARLSEPASETSTIATNLEHTSYATLHQIKSDAAVVSEQLVASIRAKAKDRDGNTGGRPSVDELKQIHKIQSLESLIRDVVDKESRYLGVHEQDAKPAKKELANGHATETGSASASGSKSGTVLTLFGNAPTPKQLFSSMQNIPSTARRDSGIKHELPVEEMSLPNGITATKVVAGPVESKKGPTFEEAFPPPYNLTALQPPKAHKRSSTRDQSVTWEFKDPVQRSKKGAGYTVQSLTVGNWLAYGGRDTADADATREKRKQRDRALSSSAGEPAQRPDRAALEEALAKEEEALFRKAYSSFAPPVDNSNAVVPEETKNLVYWHKIGNKRYNDTFAIDPALLDETEPSVAPFESFDQDSAIEVDNFDKVMEDLEALESIKPDPEPVKSKTDVDQVLRQVSELLETLASYQRNRNATLAASTAPSRTPLSPAPIVASQLGKPDEPSEEEVNTYRSLQREIAYLVMKLPPYAVAKLDGDQLSELGVKRLIKFQTKDIKGVMEEDTVTRLAKAQALATASSIASLARPNSSAGQHYSTTANRTPAIGQAANTRYGQQYGAKTPALPQFQRQASNPLSYGTPTATAPRPNYTQPNQYTRPGAPQGGFGSTPAGQFYQRPAQQTPGGFGGFGQQFQQTPQSQQRFPSQTQQQYPMPQRSVSQTAAANAIGYQTNSAAQQQAFTRTASPAKPAGYPAVSMAPNPMQQQNLQRPVFPNQPGSGRATPNNYPSQPHTPVNGFRPPPQNLQPRPASATPQPPAQGPLSTGAAQTNGTSPVPARSATSTPMQGMSQDPETGTWMCDYCEAVLSDGEARSHKCQELRCRKCGRQYVYREVFKKHRETCQG